MSIAPILETAISLALLYLLFSQVTLSINELWSGYANTRGKFLRKNLLKALGEKYTDGLYNDSAVKQLMQTPGRYTPYISDTLFSQTIINWVISQKPADSTATDPIEQFKAGLSHKTGALAGSTTLLGNSAEEFDKILSGLLLQASGASISTFDQLQLNVASWYHEFGQRMSGWYKRKERVWLLLIGLTIAVLGDLDSVRLVRFIAGNDAARATLVALGESTAQGPRPGEADYNPAIENDAYQKAESAVTTGHATLSQTLQVLKKQLTDAQQMGLPIGFLNWLDEKSDLKLPKELQRYNGNSMGGAPIIWMLIGWTITGLAMMLGAPFWFDMLCRFVNIRNLGTKPRSVPGS